MSVLLKGGLPRQIFDAVMLRTADDSIGEKAVEREVMAAMESVFPRIGLRSFFQLSGEQKRQQTEELARLVLGIRLYNREIGKSQELSECFMVFKVYLFSSLHALFSLCLVLVCSYPGSSTARFLTSSDPSRASVRPLLSRNMWKIYNFFTTVWLTVACRTPLAVVGKGGAGIDDSLSLGPQEASTLIYELEQEVAAVSEVTTLYSDVYLFIHTTKAQVRWLSSVIY